MEQMLTVSEVASMLKVHPKSVYRWIYDGKLEKCMAGGRVRFTEKQVKDFLVGKNGRGLTDAE